MREYARDDLVGCLSGSVVEGNLEVSPDSRFGHLGLFRSQDQHPETNKRYLGKY